MIYMIYQQCHLATVTRNLLYKPICLRKLLYLRNVSTLSKKYSNIESKCYKDQIKVYRRNVFIGDTKNKETLNERTSEKINLTDVLKQNNGQLNSTDIQVKTISKNIGNTKNKILERLEVIQRENIYTIPNLLCIARILASPLLGYLIIQHDYHLAFGLLITAAITDLMDGWIARTWKNQSSNLGSFLDPMADKIMIGTLVLTLTYINLIPLFLTCLIIIRDVLLVSAGFVIRYRSLPPPRTFTRYFNGSYVTAQLAPTFISKINTAVQLSLVGTTLAAPIFNYVDHIFLHSLWFITGATTVASAMSYILSKNTYKIFKQNK